MKTIEGPIKTDLQHGDPYVDEPVRKDVQVFCGKEPMTGKVLSHYKRTTLRWIKPQKVLQRTSAARTRRR